MEKLLSIVVPVYNTEKYLANCLDSLIVPGYMDQLEVLVMIDGSPDRSVVIAHEYEKRYPQTFVTVEKENGGHGSTINRGLDMANGTYFRVLDSDDWFDKANFPLYLDQLAMAKEDVVLTHVVREYPSLKKSILWAREVIDYDRCYTDLTVLNSLPPEFFAMARCAYRTSLLREHGLRLLEKRSFEEAFLHVFPLLFIRSFVYYDMAIYHYFLDRIDQSVKQKVTLKQSNDWKALVEQIVTFYMDNKKRLDEERKAFILRALKMYADNEYRTMNALPYREARKELKAYHAYLKSLPMYSRLCGKYGLLYAFMPYFMYRPAKAVYVWLVQAFRK